MAETRKLVSRKKRRRKLPGHYCWVCECRRANERFSRRGRGRCVCRDCEQLGKTELAYLQAVRNVDRCLTDSGMIRRKCRKAFEQFLHHDNPRIRDYAHELLCEDAIERANDRAERELEEVLNIVYCGQLEIRVDDNDRVLDSAPSDDSYLSDDLLF